MSSAIQTEGLTKRYGDQAVLDGVDLDIGAGGVFALLGPNGAGKTTAVHILSTLLRPDGGVARVGGHDVVRDPAAVRRLIGLTGQFSAVDNVLTGEENLRLMARLRHLPREDGRKRVRDLLERFDLADAAAQAARDLLRGDAATPRPRHESRRPSADRLPRRADHRSRSP